jgi:hypothetical protein
LATRRSPTEAVIEALTLFLGPHAARVAVERFAGRMGLRPDQIGAAEAPKLCDELLPMLKTLAGAERGEALVRKLKEDVA